MIYTLSKKLAFRLLTVLLLYFNLHPTEYIAVDTSTTARHAAGWVGILFRTLSCLDDASRPKFKKLRIFDELVIACVYVAFWDLFYSMVGKISIFFMLICFILIVLMVGDEVRKFVVGVNA